MHAADPLLQPVKHPKQSSMCAWPPQLRHRPMRCRSTTIWVWKRSIEA